MNKQELNKKEDVMTPESVRKQYEEFLAEAAKEDLSMYNRPYYLD